MVLRDHSIQFGVFLGPFTSRIYAYTTPPSAKLGVYMNRAEAIRQARERRALKRSAARRLAEANAVILGWSLAYQMKNWVIVSVPEVLRQMRDDGDDGS